MERAATTASSIEAKQDSVNAGVSKLMMLSINLPRPALVHAAWHTLTTVRHKLMLPVAFLEKPKESDGFEQIIDFLNASSIRYALTVNSTIYTSCIKQLWATAKLRRKQRKDSGPTEPVIDEAINEKHVSTPSYDQTQSGEDRMKLNELMYLYAKLSDRVLALKNTNTSQAAEIVTLKERVKKLEKKRSSRTYKSIRLYKVSLSRRIESSDDASLGAQENASKQGRKNADIDQDAEVTLIDETLGRSDDNLMFDTGILDEQEVEVEKVVRATDPVTTACKVVTTASVEILEELTLAQTLIEIKSAKPKAVTTTTTTTTITRPKARGFVVQEPSEFITTTSPSQASQLPQAKDKGKEKMVEPEKPLKKKVQIAFDEEVARNLATQLQAELEEEEKLLRQKEEEVNIALIESWDNTQAMMDADFQLAQQMQTEEQE
ncbi:hypothetical protein Tco_1081920 [Tanacetum coccineum]|uniref:Uncharacterized protein n=1 Tax=Tanacetum coccineum TaxID=301880 RepID=A0ABQ5I0E9_9ASTR